MMICQHCHARAEDGAVFCDQCGHEFGATPERLERAPLAPPSQAGAQQPQPQASAMSQRSAPRVATATQPAAHQAPQTLPIVALHLSIGQRIALSGRTEYIIGRASGNPPHPDAARAGAIC